VAAPARQPAVLLDAADDGRYVVFTVTTGETVGGEQATAPPATAPPPAANAAHSGASARDGPFAGTATTVRVGGDDAVAVSVPVLVFDARPDVRAGIGTTLRVGGTLVATPPEDDVGFLVFADGAARVVAPPPWYLDWANGLRSTFAAAAAELDGDGAALLPGLAIGDTSAVGEPLDAAMKATSLSHTISPCRHLCPRSGLP